MFEYRSIIRQNNVILNKVKYESLTSDNRLRFLSQVWSNKVKLLKGLYLPYIYSSDGELCYSDIKSQEEADKFNLYSIKLDNNHFLSDELNNSLFLRSDESALVYLNNQLVKGLYDPYDFRIWFSHTVLLNQNESLLFNQSSSYNYQLQVLEYTYKLSNPEFAINILE